MNNRVAINRREPKISSRRVEALFNRIEQSDLYRIDALKVEIAELIYLTMKQQDVKKAELARRLGTSRAYVTKLLQGNVNYTIDSLVRIAEALKCELEIQLASKTTARLWVQPHKESPAGRVLQWRNREYTQEPVETPIVHVEETDAPVSLVA